ncbi:MAG: hypothetical protein AAGL49_04395, partial [Pseudomonadota bacterium]
MKPFHMLAAAMVALLAAIAPAHAEKKKEKAEKLVLKAEETVRDFVADPDMTWLKENMNNAEAVIVVPRSVKGGFIWGGSGGNGVLLAKTDEGDWTSPAFYTLGSVT